MKRDRRRRAVSIINRRITVIESAVEKEGKQYIPHRGEFGLSNKKGLPLHALLVRAVREMKAVSSKI